MNDKNLNIPDFKDPDGENLFLASRNGLRTYGDLIFFKYFFLQLLIDFDHDLQKPLGFLSHSSDQMIFSIASCWLLGIPFVCFSPGATRHELEKQMQEIQPGLVFTDAEHKNLVSPDHHVDLEQIDLDRALSMDLKPSAKVENFKANLNPEQVFGYFFTSGTTGVPKTVPLKRRQMYFAAKASAKNFKPQINHFWLLCLPLNHIGGVSIILRSILYGSGIYRMNRFDVDMVTTFLTENTLFQAASLVPTMLKRLLDVPTFQTHKNFKAILMGGGPISPDLIQESTKRGIPMVSSYGMTETCAQIAANPILKPSGQYVPLKSVGAVFPPNEVEIRDEAGQVVCANTSGTIWLKGPQIFDGYYDDYTKPSASDDDDWFKTGDFGHINIHGHLFIENRRKDLIITGGENVSPFEIESALESIDSVVEAAVMGLPHEEWGQEVVAVIVTDNGSVKTDEILSHLRKRVTAFKVPKRIVVSDQALPRTETGKIKRTELIDLFNS